MQIAIDARGLSKRFVVGAGACRASVEVLRGIDLSIHTAESVALFGPAGSGKSTLLLCLAGLLRPDRGEIRWFGNAERAAATSRTIYHVARADLLRSGTREQRHVHLVDLRDAVAPHEQVKRWISARVEDGDAVVFATRDADFAACAGSRALAIHGGSVRPAMRPHARVAESPAVAGLREQASIRIS